MKLSRNCLVSAYLIGLRTDTQVHIIIYQPSQFDSVTYWEGYMKNLIQENLHLMVGLLQKLYRHGIKK